MDSLPKTGSEYKISPETGNVKQIDKNYPRFGEFAEISFLPLYIINKDVVKVNRVKELRVSKGMKQAELASLLKCAPTAISKYELGQRDIDSETVCRLCEIFGCSADYLLGRSELASPELSEEETRLLLAWRRSDSRARDMVRLALEPFVKEDSAEKAI